MKKKKSGFEEEFYTFYCLCGEKDRAFFHTPQKNQNIEDYVRLSYIAMAFGFKNMTLNIYKNLGNKGNEKKFRHIWAKVRKNAPIAIKWFDDFIENIPIPEFKNIADKLWEEARKKTEQDNFDMSDLIY